MAEERVAEVSRRLETGEVLAWVSMILASVVLLWHIAKLFAGSPDPAREKVLSIERIDGCEYIIGWTGTSGSREGLTHKGDCRNPIHWSHVLSDTSWYGSVRRDSNLEIHIQKGASDGEEGKAVR